MSPLNFIPLLFLFLISMLFVSTTEAVPTNSCSNAITFTPNSAFQSNLNRLLSTLYSAASDRTATGFYNATVSSSLTPTTDTAYGLFLCRGDLAATAACESCVATAVSDVFQLCRTSKQVIYWSDNALCMLRYSNESFFSTVSESPRPIYYNVENSTDPTGFNRVLGASMNSVATAASSEADKFATDKANFTGSVSIYSLAQCTQDLSAADCNRCLRGAIAQLPSCCNSALGAVVLSPSCIIRYEVKPIVQLQNSTSAPPPSPVALPPPPPPPRNGNKKKIIIIVLVVSAAFVTLLVLGCIFLRVKKRWVKLEDDEKLDDISLAESLRYDFDTIRSATDDFSDANKLGKGGFGAVYKGRLPDGQYIAVKRLSKNSEQGDRQFTNEVVLLAQLQHRNLVRLLGFCLESEERLLIYEYVANKSLDHFIFDPDNLVHLDWETRYKIIGGIARGILYLHEDSQVRIIHRDLKPGNILLDADMNPKIADFGMARLFPIDQTQGDTRTIVGTYGYMAPEYVIHGRFSVKTDVFSFGVLVLELISGKKIGSFQHGENEENLLSYAWRNWREDTIQNIIDPMLTSSSRTETMRCIHIGLLCVQGNVVDRPTVASVVSMLNSQSITLSVPTPPAFHVQRNFDSDLFAMTESSPVYVTSNDPSEITEPCPR